jgi:hypothetical protein
MADMKGEVSYKLPWSVLSGELCKSEKRNTEIFVRDCPPLAANTVPRDKEKQQLRDTGECVGLYRDESVCSQLLVRNRVTNLRTTRNAL